MTKSNPLLSLYRKVLCLLQSGWRHGSTKVAQPDSKALSTPTARHSLYPYPDAMLPLREGSSPASQNDIRPLEFCVRGESIALDRPLRCAGPKSTVPPANRPLCFAQLPDSPAIVEPREAPAESDRTDQLNASSAETSEHLPQAASTLEKPRSIQSSPEPIIANQ